MTEQLKREVEQASKIALFDLDGTLADFEGAMQEQLEQLRSPDDPPVDLWREATPAWLENRMRLIKNQTGFWTSLQPIHTGFVILQLCVSLGYRIHVLTKGPKKVPLAWGEKLEWCQEHLGDDFEELTVTQDKGLTYGRVLVDDYPEYMLRWLEWRPRGLGIMPVTRHNLDFQHPQVIKWDNTSERYNEIRYMLAKHYQRPEGESG